MPANTRHTPEAGRVAKDADSGTETGIVREAAVIDLFISLLFCTGLAWFAVEAAITAAEQRKAKRRSNRS